MAEVDRLPDTALDGDIAVLGRKGGGKTFTSKGIVERLLDLKRRVLILDPLGVWAGLRTSADGEAPGYPVAIFGGQHGDEPLDPALAVPLAQIIAGENLPTIIDLSELTKTAQGRFLYIFLHELRRVNRDALTVVLEEADVFAPQNPQGDDSKLLHSEIDWISRRGRFRGFRLISITQRPARLSKDVLTQCSTLIAHKLPAPQDRDAVKAWVEGNGDRDLAKQVFDTLASLAVGEGWVWSPEHDILQRMTFPRIKTLDTSATPKAGESRIEPKTLAQVDMTGIRRALAEARAARDADEKKSAKAGAHGATAPDPQAIAAADQEGFKRGDAAGYARAMAEVRAAFGQTHDFVVAFWQRIAGAGGHALPPEGMVAYAEGNAGGALFSSIPREALGPSIMGAELTTRPPTAKGDRFYPEPAARPTQEGEPPAAAKIVAALDLKDAPAMTWTQIALLTGYSESGGQFRRGKKYLIDTGAVVESGEGVRLKKVSKNAGTMPTGDALVALWAPKLPPAGQATLQQMWGQARARSGGVLSIDAVAAHLNYQPSGGQWRRGVKALRDARIAQTAGPHISFTSDFLKIAVARHD